MSIFALLWKYLFNNNNSWAQGRGEASVASVWDEWSQHSHFLYFLLGWEQQREDSQTSGSSPTDSWFWWNANASGSYSCMFSFPPFLLWWMLSLRQAAAEGDAIFLSLPAINLLNNTLLMKWQCYHTPVTSSNGVATPNSDQTVEKQGELWSLSSGCDSSWKLLANSGHPSVQHREPSSEVCWPSPPTLQGQKCPHMSSHCPVGRCWVFVWIHLVDTCGHLRSHFLLLLWEMTSPSGQESPWCFFLWKPSGFKVDRLFPDLLLFHPALFPTWSSSD